VAKVCHGRFPEPALIISSPPPSSLRTTMAQRIRDSFLDLERHRQLLEDNISKLRASLRHWQIWEAEYEGLKEEILGAKQTPNRKQLVALARQYEGELVKKKEIEEILGPETRDAKQVVNLLDRRMDYVEQNVRTVQKQIDAAENKLAAASVISTPDVRNEEGLPLTEIMEELDEEGNVISSSTSTAGSVKPQLLEVLKKAGVELPASLLASESIQLQEEAEPTPASQPPVESKPKSTAEATKPTKKGVQFTEDTKSGPEPEKSRTAKRLEDIMSIAKQSEANPSEPAVIPTDETPEDAALRREMLQYGISEVGAVVAELNLEDGSDWEDGDYEDDTTDDEDAYGRSTGRVVDDELRQRMIELEERLGVRMMENVGKKASDIDIVREGIGRISINGQEDVTSKSDEAKKIPPAKSEHSASKKSVRFSDELDISPASKPAPAPVVVEHKAAPVSDIIERSVPAQPAQSTTTQPQKKQSRFKSARATPANVINGPLSASTTRQTGPPLPLFPAKPSTPKPFSQSIKFAPAFETPQTVPTGPKGKILAPEVIERDVPLNTASEPDDLDPHLLQQEVATEYHRMRNRMIQRQGGFLKEEESEIVPLTEEEGGPKKMSRFKAARLAKS
jgi:unconventional prefoldin RPB5 interactor 1